MTPAVAGSRAMSNLDAARLVLAGMGISPADLMQDAGSRAPAPTFEEYIPLVRKAVSESTGRHYGTYWKRVAAAWGTRQLTDVTALDISQLAETTRASALQRRNSRNGRSAAEHMLSALRCLYSHAIADGLVEEASNPAARVTKPRRLPSTRGALPSERLSELFAAASATGNDPELDTLILRLHTETACRRGGALALTPADLDAEQCLIRLREKGGTIRWQPVSPTLMTHLLAHGRERGGLEPETRLLRYRDGRPITYRRYDHLWQRLGRHLPWVAAQQISTHWLRHTTLTWVERNFGYAVAQAYAGHSGGSRDPSATATYVRASRDEVAAAVAALTREAHPLAPACHHIHEHLPHPESARSGKAIPEFRGAREMLC